MNHYNNIRYFYKYLKAETALLILQNRKLKYSSPLLFNDPFDVQTTVDYGFELSDMMEAFNKELYELTYGETEPIGDESDLLFSEILKKRKIVKAKSLKIPFNDFIAETKTRVEQTVERTKQNIEDFNKKWKIFVKASKVFCIAEEHDNLLMWSHYAKNHTGVVIKFECLRELDTPLCIAQQIDYVPNPPIIASLEDYIPYITGQDKTKINHDLLIYKLFQSKSVHWQYEKEWRIWIPPLDMESPSIPRDSKGNEILFELRPYYPKEIHSIYFGCKIDDVDRQKIEKELTGDFQHVNKYLCVRSEKEYKLDFELIR